MIAGEVIAKEKTEKIAEEEVGEKELEIAEEVVKIEAGIEQRD